MERPRSLQLDPVLLGVTLALLLLGMVMVGSASISIADRDLGQPFFFLNRQGMALAMGLIAGIVALGIPTVVWERTGFLLLLLALVLLAVVLLPGVGHEVNGSTRWLRYGPITVQVSEPARLLILMYLAGYLVRRQHAVRTSLFGFLRPMILIGLACGLLLAEPDFGAAVVLMATALGVMFVAGVRFRDFLTLFGGAVFSFGILAFASPYRLERLTTFLDPWADPFDAGFQLTQSLIAIGRGGWFGVGVGGSVQKLFYLPEAHTDFVFAVLAEEIGLVGVIVTIALFAAVVWRAFAIAREAARNGRHYQAYLAFGLGIWLGLQVFINIAVNMGLLPTKGLTLPLLSYGRSSLVVTCIALGLLLRIHHELGTAGVAALTRRGAQGGKRARRRGT